MHGLGRLENVCKSLAEHSVVAAPHNILFALTYLPTMHQPEPEPAREIYGDGRDDGLTGNPHTHTSERNMSKGVLEGERGTTFLRLIFVEFVKGY